MRIQYGGTFDPVHNGHLAVACAARDALSAQVYLMPAADPPHKGPTHANAMQRATMLELAIQNIDGLQVDLRELARHGPSWTVDSLHELRIELGASAPLALLIGTDSYLQLHTWRRWREVFNLAHLVIAERPGSVVDGGGASELATLSSKRWAHAWALSQCPAGLLYRLKLPLRPESATALRAAIAAGEAWRGDVPGQVADFIHAHALYRTRSADMP